MAYGYFMRQRLGRYWAYIFLTYGVIPMLDQILAQDWKNPTLKEIIELENDYHYRMVLYIMVSLDIFIFVVEVGNFGSFTLFNFLPLLFVLADGYSKEILLSHELAHKENWFNHTVGSILLTKNCYFYYTIDHN